MNKFKGTKIEYHILQSFPVTCLNRDDVGAPKTAVVGGVERGRVSSQCWKRQVRLALHDLGIRIGVRSKRIFDLIVERCEGELTEEKSNFIKAVTDCFLSKETLFFVSENEIDALAEYIDNVTDYKAEKDLSKKVFRILKENSIKGSNDLDGLDIFLFGRMAANATELNVEAASSFSHAITTHKLNSSVDFFTAVDDFVANGDSQGAGHLGTSEFSSGTYYRYVSLDLGLLFDYLRNENDLEKAVDAFTKALFIALPAARQTTFAGFCPWNYARVLVRKGQNIQISFDKPVKAKGEGYLSPSIEVMNNEIDRNEALFASLYGKIADYAFGENREYSIDKLSEDLCNTVKGLC